KLALELLEPLGTDALDVLQLLDRFECSVRLAVVENRLRLCRADARQRNELLLRCGVEIERGERAACPQCERNRQQQSLHDASIVISEKRAADKAWRPMRDARPCEKSKLRG